jgi:hypothetical protein
VSAKFGTGTIVRSFVLEPGDIVTISDSDGEGKPFRPVTAIVTACIQGADRVRAHLGLEPWLAPDGGAVGASSADSASLFQGEMVVPAPADLMVEADERVLEGIMARMRASIEAEIEGERRVELEELAGIKEKLLRKLGVEPGEQGPDCGPLEKKRKRAIDLELA